MIKLETGDKLFKDSPDSGAKNCICSRCGNVIRENEVPIRMWTTNEQDEVDDQSMEYRYCEGCQTKSGMTIIKSDDDFHEEHY